MAESAVITAAVLTGGLGIGANVMMQQAQSENPNPYWYDFVHKYVRVSDEFTRDIDNLLLLSKKTKVGTKFLFSSTLSLPDVGKHRYYSSECKFPGAFITLEKRSMVVGDSQAYFYLCIIFPGFTNIFREFTKDLFESIQGTAKVVSIDTSIFPRLMSLNKICHPACLGQQQAIDAILHDYDQSPKKNIKVVIFGPVGTRKSYTARVLKKQLDTDRNIACRLYDDVDPSMTGVNINTMALQHATETSPVILVIDEIDVAFKRAAEGKDSHDPRIMHAKNKQTLNLMLDNVGDFRFVIAVYTTNKTRADLQALPEYETFIRDGRVDMWLHMQSLTSCVRA
eukprot:gene20746-23560_t